LRSRQPSSVVGGTFAGFADADMSAGDAAVASCAFATGAFIGTADGSGAIPGCVSAAGAVFVFADTRWGEPSQMPPGRIAMTIAVVAFGPIADVRPIRRPRAGNFAVFGRGAFLELIACSSGPGLSNRSARPAFPAVSDVAAGTCRKPTPPGMASGTHRTRPILLSAKHSSHIRGRRRCLFSIKSI